MESLKLIVVFLLATARQSTSQRVRAGASQGLSACPVTNPDEYNKCLLAEVKKIQPMIAVGVPELGIPPLDPLVLNNIKLQRSEPPVTLNSVFSNVRISGIKDMDIKYLNVDIFKPKKTMSMGLVVPTMIMRGQYLIDGNIFLLPIEGQGNFIAKLDTVIVEGSANIIPTGRGVKTTTDNVNVGFKIKNMAMKMDNLFEGNKILSDTMHHFLNENGQVVLEEIRPELTKTLNDLISGLFTAIFDSAPTDLHEHARISEAASSVSSRGAAAARSQPAVQQRPQRRA